MPVHNRLASTLALFASISLLAGCWNERRVVVEVTDAATGEPVEGVKVSTEYPGIFNLIRPSRKTAIADDAGRASLKAVIDHGTFTVVAECDGFFDRRAWPRRRNTSADGFTSASLDDGTPLYRLTMTPRPTIRLRLPDAAPSAVIIRWEQDHGTTVTPNRYIYDIDVPTSGQIDIAGPSPTLAPSFISTNKRGKRTEHFGYEYIGGRAGDSNLYRLLANSRSIFVFVRGTEEETLDYCDWANQVVRSSGHIPPRPNFRSAWPHQPNTY